MSKRERLKPGQIRDAIAAYMKEHQEGSIAEVRTGVSQSLGREISRSSIQSHFNLNGKIYERTGRGRYRLRNR